MADQPFSPNGESQRPALPWILFAISTIVAVLATAGFVFLITKRTTGPVEVLRDFYAAAHDQDCDATYDLLAPRAKNAFTPGEWCEELESSERVLPESFEVEEVVLEGDTATVRVTDSVNGPAAWQLERDGRSWLVAGQVSVAEGVKPEAPQSP